MSTMTAPSIPENAPFSVEQRAWLNGMFAGLYSSQTVDPTSLIGGDGAAAAPSRTVTVLYGTQTGNAEGLARRTTKAAKERGLQAACTDMGAYDVARLAEEEYVLIVSSTYGEGDMPDNAQLFWEELESDDAPALDALKFSVLALGDSSYFDFCEAGKNFDRRLEELGAERVAPRVDCDVDFEDPFASWLDTVMDGLSDAASGGADAPAGYEGDGAVRTPSVTPSGFVSGDGAPSEDDVPAYSKTNPFPATLLTSHVLNGDGSNKETRHVEISLAGSGLSYDVGDAVGVVPANCSDLVDEFIDALGFSGNESVPGAKGGEVLLREALLTHYEIGSDVPFPLLEAVAEATADEELAQLLQSDSHKERNAFLWGREVIDFVTDYPEIDWAADAFVDLLRPLMPRLYSIASSPTLHPNTVHTTMATVRYAAHGRTRKGVCSTFLAERIRPGATVSIYLQPNNHFRLPDDPDRPMIMVGPGTGIAPFRGFLQERRATQASGKNWLFFGEQHVATDFLYEDELTGMVEDGTLDRLDTAFSRDQDEKVYVQHRMLEQADQLYGWLEEGACFYVCGDRTHMAKDVDAALHAVIETAGEMSEDDAAAYVQALKKEGRYQRDVY